MTSTTPIEPSVEGLATWLRDQAAQREKEDTHKIFPHAVDILRGWASAVESLALERIAVPQAVPAQAELSDDEIMELTRAECEYFRWPSSALSIARAILNARKDRADALLREAVNELEAWAGGHTRADSIIAAIRTYLKGEA
jgi:hypothetical protein